MNNIAVYVVCVWRKNPNGTMSEVIATHSDYLSAREDAWQNMLKYKTNGIVTLTTVLTTIMPTHDGEKLMCNDLIREINKDHI